MNRGIPQTHVLITSALQIGKKLVRLTLGITVYSTPPREGEELPPPIRANLLLSPQSLLESLYIHSLKFFTPRTEGPHAAGIESQRNLSLRYLPQVVVTLVPTSLKLGALGEQSRASSQRGAVLRRTLQREISPQNPFNVEGSEN